MGQDFSRKVAGSGRTMLDPPGNCSLHTDEIQAPLFRLVAQSFLGNQDYDCLVPNAIVTTQQVILKSSNDQPFLLSACSFCFAMGA
jgi:hypothetical protein